MADPSAMAETMKQFASKITTSKVKERQKILGDLVPCVAKPDLPEQALKGVMKHLLMTLLRYYDNKSRKAVEEVIKTMSETHREKFSKIFVTAMSDVAESMKKVAPCSLHSGMALTALSWSCLVMRVAVKDTDNMKGAVFEKMVYQQSMFLYGALAVNRSTIKGGAYNRLKRVWNEMQGSVALYASALKQVEQTMELLVMANYIMKYLVAKKDQDTITLIKKDLVEQYTKLVLGSRAKPTLHLLKNCSCVLVHVSHDEFKGTLLPATDRAMLRNPEITLEAFVHMLNGLSIDLSPYATDISKHLATQLHSKDEDTCDVAGEGCRYLAKQCSDPSAVEKVVKHFFGVLNGSEGKLSVTSQRLGVLTGIGNMSYNTVSGSNSTQNLSSAVTELFIPLLQQEVHEGTLVHALSMFSLWCAKFNTEVPDKIIQWFKTGMGLKASTSAVRNAYIKAMNVSFHGDTLIQGQTMVPLLIQAMEKAQAQASQVQLVSEAVSAACLLLKLSLSDIQVESKLGGMWTILMDHDKQLFTSDKFLATASEDALMTLATLIEKIVLGHPQKLADKMASSYHRALIYVLAHGSHKQRKHTQNCIRKILSTLGGAKVAVLLLKEFRQLLGTQKVIDWDNVCTENGEGSTESSKYISARVLTESLMCLSYLPSADPREARTIAMETMFDAHHPCIVQFNMDAWTDILQRLKIDAAQFLNTSIVDILADIKNMSEINQNTVNVVKTLVRIAPGVTMPGLVEHICSTLDNPSLLTVTVMEVLIMNSPESELFDKSVLETGAQGDQNIQNMKRENKLYSYKEQMAEMELKKEMEKKKRKEGKLKDEAPKLSKKQQEAMHAQMQKEKEIRLRVAQLDREVRNVCQLLDGCVAGNPDALRSSLLPGILHTLISLMASPLAAPIVSLSYVHLRNIAFRNDIDQYFSLLVAHCTLRLLQPACQLEKGWTEEPLSSQAIRATNEIHNRTVQVKNKPKRPDVKLFSAPTFSYCFYLMKNILAQGGVAVGGDDKVILHALAVISAHAQMRVSQDDDTDEYSPELLPRKDMLELLTRMIGTSGGRVQQMAARALLETSMCASAMEGCAAAEQEEIDVLLTGVQSPALAVREACLQGLLAMMMVLPTPDGDYDNGMMLCRRVWVARYDREEEIRKLADRLWEEAGLTLEADLCTMLYEDVIHDESVVRESGAEALSAALSQNKDYVPAVLQQLLDVYEEKLYQPPPVLDSFGRVISEAPPDQWPARCGIAMAICKMSSSVSEDQISSLFNFYVEKGLGDRSEEVRKHMLNAAVAAVNDHGKEHVTDLLTVFEKFLADAPNTAGFDAVRQSVVILMGSLAKHLDKEDPKVKPIVAKLIETLSTPSQQVQEAVANCLPPLVPAIKADAPELVQKLLQLLLESENYGERKGAAYGLAGLVKGLGILALKQLEIMVTLQNAIQNKKNPRYREGALFAFEMLCLMLGRLFEPYVVHILPHLLLCFGDPNQYVREAADDTAKAVMSKLSAHGVKLVLPSLLSALEEDSWRTKTGSVELLGAMAYCAPKQLSACLPSIVPKLMEVLTDSHLKVQKAGAQALKQIGAVIKNPEIQAIVPNLLDALQDPTRKTTPCLQTLLETKFVHFIDAPSLALIMPVVQRAFQDRSTETRKMAAQIIGNMYSLTDQKDLSPYLPNVIPGLKQSLLDPVPEVRSVSARALGAMVKGMGESGFEDLLPWLMQTLTSENSSVDRSGAAQGLSEVVGGLGMEKLNKLMPDIISTADRQDIVAHVRDGYIMMYIYLPSVFGDDFLPYVGPIIPSILKALADENEYVRDTALKAGQRIVNMYANTAIELLLPELERGLFDDNWRIRYSSVQLLGDLLYRVSGVSGKMSTEGAGDDDNFGTESSQKAIFSALGDGRRNRVLAGLYMGRSDTALMVRQAALHVWKIIVTHTPKTLREILSTLFSLLLGCLASSSYDKRQVAARTLGDVVRKLGEKVLPEIIPILEKGLESERSDQRQGVCIGLSEIMSSTSKDHVIVFADSLIPTVRRALCDPLPEVREAAAKTFDNLHANIGPRALDDILPDLLRKLDDMEQSEYALDGLKQVMAVKSRVVLPYLVPQLTSAPVNTRALSFLSSVAGDALNRHLNKILPALMSALSEKMGTPDEQQELEYCQSVVLSVSDDVGVRIVMDELLLATQNDTASLRCAAVTILHAYCQQTRADYSEYVPQLFRGLVSLFTDEDEWVLHAAWDCLNAVTKKLDNSEMLQHITNMRQALRFAVSDFKGENLPGFCLPKKGIAPIWLIFREGILNGPPELKESAAIGLGEVIKRTSPDALKPSVVGITGPLIRILGDRFTYHVKVAVLETLGLLLAKCGAMLKPFLPQLQTTFVKALNDPTRSVRLKAADALGKLIVIHTRVDPLFTELHTGVKNADDSAIRDTMLQALRGCISGAGVKMSDPLRKQVTSTLEGYLSTPEDTTRSTAAACLGALCQCLPNDELAVLLNMQLLDVDAGQDWVIRHGRSVGLSVALKEAPEKLLTDEFRPRVLKAIYKCVEADRIPLCMSGLRCAGFVMRNQILSGKPPASELIGAVVKGMKHESNDIKQLSALIVSFVARSSTIPIEGTVMKQVVPMLVNGIKEKNTLVRTNSEQALINVLRLREGDNTLQTCLSSLEPGMRDSLNDSLKTLKKAAQAVDPGEENIDDTILT